MTEAEYGFLSPMHTLPSGQRVIDYSRMASDTEVDWSFLDDPEFRIRCEQRLALNAGPLRRISRVYAPGLFIGNGAKDGTLP